MKPKELAKILDIKPESLRTKINRAITKGEIDALELEKGWSFSMKEDLPEYIVNWVNAQFIAYDKQRLDELKKLASSDLKHGLNEAQKHIEKELGETYSIRKRQKKSISLRKRLSSDVLVISVLVVMLMSDMVAFYLITNYSFGDLPDWLPRCFAIVGLAVGVGGVITFSRIKNERHAEFWKWIFAFFQAAVFICALFQYWDFGKVILTIMTSTVFAGVVTSVRE